MPTTGADNGLTLADMRDADYDDPRWEKLMDQLTVDEMANMIAMLVIRQQPWILWEKWLHLISMDQQQLIIILQELVLLDFQLKLWLLPHGIRNLHRPGVNAWARSVRKWVQRAGMHQV